MPFKPVLSRWGRHDLAAGAIGEPRHADDPHARWHALHAAGGFGPPPALSPAQAATLAASDALFRARATTPTQAAR